RDKRSCPLLPSEGGSKLQRFLTGRALRTCIESVFVCSCSSVFSAPSFWHRVGSTAKRDQSFICAYPAFREGLHGRLSLGNPPALKQSFRCIGKQRLPSHRPVTARTGGNSR